jgi:hypothetical protein
LNHPLDICNVPINPASAAQRNNPKTAAGII